MTGRRAAEDAIDDEVGLTIWFIKDRDPESESPDWPDLVDGWSELFDQSGRFHVKAAVACRLEDITARDYVESDVLDLDSLSVEAVRE